MGNALVARLFYSLRRAGVPIWLNASLQELKSRESRVDGAVCRRSAQAADASARRAVVLATGGFGGSVERLNANAAAAARTCRAHSPARAGDGMRDRAHGRRRSRGRPRGARVLDPVSATGWLAGGPALSRISSLDRAKPGLIAVNPAGRRFVNEALSYHDFVDRDASLARNSADHSGVARLRPRLHQQIRPRPRTARDGRSLRRFIANGYLIEAETLEALARKIGVDAADLRARVAEHNRYAETGDR